MTWSAKQYTAFEDERTRPARDLLAAVPDAPMESAIDVGCGPGNSTELLATRFPDARISGFDSSADMVAAARARLPHIRFEVADVHAWVNADAPASDRPGLIFANAVLQWVPGHAHLFPALVSKLVAGGCLAVQMPDNLGEPVHTLMRELAREGLWKEKLVAADESRPKIEPALWYYDLLRPRCTRVDVWRTTYHHPLAGAPAVVEWFKGTGLLPFLAPLEPEERGEFLSRYTRAVERAYPAGPDGTVLLPFPRLFVVATRR